MKFLALMQLQWRNTYRNPIMIVFVLTSLVTSAIMAVLAVGISQRAGTVPFEIPSMMLLMATFFVGWNVPANCQADENEKGALRALLLAPVTPMQAALARACVAAGLTAAVGLAILLIHRQLPARPGLLLGAFALAMLFTIALGTLNGLLARDMRSLGAYGTPVILVLMFGATLPWKLFLPAVWAVQTWLPTRPMYELLQAGMTGETVPVAQDILIMLAYSALVAALCTWQLRKLSPLR